MKLVESGTTRLLHQRTVGLEENDHGCFDPTRLICILHKSSNLSFNLNFTLRFSLLALGWDKVLSVFTFLAVCYGVCVGLGAVEIISNAKVN